MRLKSAVVILVGFTASAFAQLPDFYHKVDRMTWVVEDLEKTMQGWARLGFTDVVRHGRIDLPGVVFRGEPVAVQVEAATVAFGDVPVDWVQPVAGKSAYSEFLERHGSGVFSLLHRTPSREAYLGEMERLAQLGVKVLQKGFIPADNGFVDYAYLDTESEGKYVLGLVYVPDTIQNNPLALPSGLEPKRTISQYAFVVRNLEAVSRYWNRVGFPPMDVTHPALWDLRYHAETADFDAKLGWQRHGRVVYEWILPLKGPTVYEDHLEKRGEGFHHLAFSVEDFDRAVQEWTELGFPFIQGGAWGEKDQPGYGRFAYQDTDAIGGIDIELLWNFR